MERSEQQKAVLELGKLLVKELGLEKGVDTLSRWMAHYVAEKIKYAESLAVGVKKNNAEKECFSLILDLWKHRWHYISNRRPLRDFNHLFDILENLDPEKEEPYYYSLGNTQSKEEEEESFDPSDLKNVSSLALQIDKVARIWISYFLQEAGRKAKNEKIKKMVNAAVKLPDSMDARIIQIVIADSMENIDKEPVDHEELAREIKIKTLNRRIGELKKFKKVNKYLIGQFEKELNNLKK
jgi:muconolactone delta-isomerase